MADLFPFLLFPLPAVSAFVEAYDAVVSGPVAEYMSLSKKIGGDVQKHVGTKALRWFNISLVKGPLFYGCRQGSM